MLPYSFNGNLRERNFNFKIFLKLCKEQEPEPWEGKYEVGTKKGTGTVIMARFRNTDLYSLKGYFTVKLRMHTTIM
jgi:hypothetical protein